MNGSISSSVYYCGLKYLIVSIVRLESQKKVHICLYIFKNETDTVKFYILCIL